jgi:hypothetical protein
MREISSFENEHLETGAGNRRTLKGVLEKSLYGCEMN